jgi:hypothetical protein
LNSEILQSLQDDKTSAGSKFRAGLLGIFNQHKAMIGDVGKALGQIGCESDACEASAVHDVGIASRACRKRSEILNGSL